MVTEGVTHHPDEFDEPAVSAGDTPGGYTPAETTDWTGADPTTIAEALDRIAAALGPIG